MNTLTKGQRIALGQHLSEYPENVAFNTIIQLLLAHDDNIGVWEPLEDWDVSTLAQHLTDLSQAIDEVTTHVQN